MSQFNRPEDFSLQRLIFSPEDVEYGHAAWNQMAIFEFRKHSEGPALADSFLYECNRIIYHNHYPEKN